MASRLAPFAHGAWKRLTYANVMATLAFFFAFTGVAAAGVKYLATTDVIPSTSDLGASTYGNPLIGAGKVTSAKVADGAITTSKLDSAATAPNAGKLGGQPPSAFVRVLERGTATISDGTNLGPGQCVQALGGEYPEDLLGDQVIVTDPIRHSDITGATAVAAGSVSSSLGPSGAASDVAVEVCNVSSSGSLNVNGFVNFLVLG